MSIRRFPEIGAEQENFRLEQLPGLNMHRIRRDPVEPVPVGTHIAKIFRITGYDPDCDGSLMARLEEVDRDGKSTGWEPDCIGLFPETAVTLDTPGDLHAVSEAVADANARTYWLCTSCLNAFEDDPGPKHPADDEGQVMNCGTQPIRVIAADSEIS
jgi:hypothetical protein